MGVAARMAHSARVLAPASGIVRFFERRRTEMKRPGCDTGHRPIDSKTNAKQVAVKSVIIYSLATSPGRPPRALLTRTHT